MESVTAFLAQSATQYEFDSLPPHVIRVAQSCILDWLGVTIAAADESVVVAVRDTLSGGGDCTLVGSDRAATPLAAARINGTAGHVLDYDDVHAEFGGHPTVPILPAILALAESDGSSGRELITAFVAGLETESRINAIVAPSHYAMGFHTTASVGVFGAAAAAARLMSLDPDQTAHALGLASISASGLKSGFGTWGKSLQVGHAAHEGALAATLAGKGAVGPADGIECDQGFARTHSTEQDFAAAMQPVGKPWHTKDVLFKYHASCYGTHSSIESLLRLREHAGAAEVSGIDLAISPRHVGMCTQVDVSTPLQAKFSLAFTSALAWARGSAAREDFAPAVVSDGALQTLAGKVTTTAEDNRDFHLTDVRVHLADGTTLREEVDMSLAVPEGQLDAQWDKLAAKFHSLVDPICGIERAGQIVDTVAKLADLDNVAKLTALTRPNFGG
ncbi:2-methylcitrate dehydratase PrpD [Antricoccus suffuscus]|uniref:2-methylcitrate dehydratase PrpD n=1 Tax=Antricoccus suffuscus TaxID=1629062 RepID=A0A2T1A6B9_9ACTN|nr:MmgE/PrpD family protein [Antricoccus suffuscus]PRZ44136.1 2-methylcitrate dehydratase PrpD [Antricoccus suffuscus]